VRYIVTPSYNELLYSESLVITCWKSGKNPELLYIGHIGARLKNPCVRVLLARPYCVRRLKMTKALHFPAIGMLCGTSNMVEPRVHVCTYKYLDVSPTHFALWVINLSRLLTSIHRTSSIVIASQLPSEGKR
jgi:hypothetical protein